MQINRREFKTAVLVAVIACLWIGVSSLNAAEHRGQVKFGGLPVPGATVTATQGDKKLVTTTDLDGNYLFPTLADGNWTVEVDVVGFSPIKQEVTLPAPIGSPAPPEFELKMLALDEMKTEKSAPIVTGITSSSTPAATTAETMAPKNAKGGTIATPAASSQSGFQRANVRATANNTTAANNPPATEAPSTDTSSELSQRASDGFLVNGSSVNGASSQFAFNPALGNNRRGARSLYNGNVAFNIGNSALNARPFSLTGQDTPKPESTQFTGNLSFGGPIKIPHIIKNGPTFTIGYSWTRSRQAQTSSALVPTDAERQGDFTSVRNQLGQPVQLIDPTTGLPIVGNVLAPTQISSQARALLALYPHANFTGSSIYNYQIPLISPTHGDAGQFRTGKQLNRTNTLNGQFALQSNRSDTPSIFGFEDTNRTLGFNVGLNLRHTFTPRFYGTIAYQFSRQSIRATPFFENRVNFSGNSGITGNDQEPINWGPPNLSFAGSGIQGFNENQASFTRNASHIVNYDSTWNRGRHNVAFGGVYRLQQLNNLSQQNARGTFTFNGTSGGYDFADFLLGVPDASAIAFGNADKYLRSHGVEAYVNDDFRMNSSVSINAGVRWVYGSPITELYGRLVNLDIAPGFTAVAPVVANNPVGSLTGQQYPDSLVHPDKHQFQPQIGIAWRPISGSSMLIRAGYSLSYNTSVYQSIVNQMTQQSPLSKSLSVQNTAANPLTLANGFNAAPNITTNTFAVDPNFRVGYAQNWQLSLQRDLPASLQMLITYNGIKGTRQPQDFLPNTYPTGAVNPCPLCPTGFTYLTSNGNSTREAGIIQLRRRLRNGFTASLQYTYSKSIDDTAPSSGSTAQNWLDLSAERGLSSFDQRHLLNFTGQYTSGVGLGGGALLRGWKGAILKEWTVVTGVNVGSGLPLNATYSGIVSGTGFVGLRPNYTGADLYAAPDGKFLNASAFSIPTAGQWGNAARNSITGPMVFNMSASMSRTFRVNDRISMDLNVNSTNPINHVTYSSWGTNITSNQFGVVTAANGMRNLSTSVRMRF